MRHKTQQKKILFIISVLGMIQAISFYFIHKSRYTTISEHLSERHRQEALNTLNETLHSRQTTPLRPCSDEVFLRRIYLDTLGQLPTINDIHQFEESTNPHKRSELINTLVERPEWADLMTMRFCDMLRVKSEFPVNLWPNAVQLWHRKIKEDLITNKPYSEIVTAWLTSEGSNFRIPEVNFFRSTAQKKASGLAKITALNLLGMRYDKLSTKEQEQLDQFFTHVRYKPTHEWKEEIVYFEKNLPSFEAYTPDMKKWNIHPAKKSPSHVFAEWITAPDNPLLAEAFVNRVWHWIFGQGMIHPADDLSLTIPGFFETLKGTRPSLVNHDPTLTLLARYFQESNFNIKELYKIILNSKAYQSESIPDGYYPIRRLDAEIIYDILQQSIGFKESYSSVIPEPFTFLPKNIKAVQIADGSISSSFLDSLGRPSRDQGLLSERNNKNTEAQHLFFMNSAKMNQYIIGSAKAQSKKNTPKEQIIRLYQIYLSRKPSPEEMEIALAHILSFKGKEKHKGWEDFLWSLINSKEFIYQH